MTRKFFSLFFYILSSGCIIAAVLAVFASFIIRDLTYYTQLTLKQLEETAGYRITLDNIDWSITHGAGVRIDNLAITESGSTTPLFQCSKVNILTALFPLFKKRLVVSKIIFTDPQILLSRTSDGAWHLPSFPSFSDTSREPDKILDISIALKRIIIENAIVIIRDDLSKRTARLENLTCSLSFNRTTRQYSIAGQVQQHSGKITGTAAFEGSFAFTSPFMQVQNITGTINVSLKNIFLSPFILIFSSQTMFPDITSTFNGAVSAALSSDNALSMSGNLQTQNFMLRQDNATAESFGPIALDFKATTDEQLQGSSAAITVAFGDAVTIDSTMSLKRSTENNILYLDVSAAARQCSIAGLKQLLFSHAAWHERFSALLNHVQSGDVVKGSFTASGVLQDFIKGSFQNCKAAFELKNFFIKLVDTLPSLHCTSVTAGLDNDTLTGSLTAQLFGTDNQTIDFTVSSLLHDPSVTAQITSSVLAQHLQELSSAFPGYFKNDYISFTSGHTSARTIVKYYRNLILQTDIDLSETSYTLAESIIKPAGQSNSISIILFKPTHTAAATSNNAPLFINFMLADSLVLNGTVIASEKPSLIGTYMLNSFDLTSCRYPALSSSHEITGLISGSGSFLLPVTSPSRCPLAGSLIIDNFKLFNSDNNTELAGLSLATVMTDTSIYILRCGAHFGVTRGTLTGSLSNILPLEGNLKIFADIFDIDDFVKTVEHVQSLNKSMDIAFDAPETVRENSFVHTALDMDFTAFRVNFMNWDFENGTCRYTYKNGVMRWDDINVTGGNGLINGLVVYDFANPSLKTLILEPSRSNSDFIWAIPSMHTKQTITGTMDLRGEFRSTFSKKSEIGPNMNGAFHVTVTNGIIQKFTVLSKILTMLNIPHFAKLKADDIFENGMPFDSITSDFVMHNAIMKTENLFLRGPAMNLTAVGDINLMTEIVDLIVGAQILETIGRILGNIPIAGELVTGKDKSLTIGYFHVSGPYPDASVTPMPVKSISGPVLKIFKSILDIPRDLFFSDSDNSTQTNKSSDIQQQP